MGMNNPGIEVTVLYYRLSARKRSAGEKNKNIKKKITSLRLGNTLGQFCLPSLTVTLCRGSQRNQHVLRRTTLDQNRWAEEVQFWRSCYCTLWQESAGRIPLRALGARKGTAAYWLAATLLRDLLALYPGAAAFYGVPDRECRVRVCEPWRDSTLPDEVIWIFLRGHRRSRLVQDHEVGRGIYASPCHQRRHLPNSREELHVAASRCARSSPSAEGPQGDAIQWYSYDPCNYCCNTRPGCFFWFRSHIYID